MVFGGVAREHFQLNESTLYSGDPDQTFSAIDVRRNFKEVSSLLDAKKFKEAERLVADEWLGRNHQSYQPLGDMFIDFRSEEHTSELQSLMRISYAVFCLQKKNQY